MTGHTRRSLVLLILLIIAALTFGTTTRPVHASDLPFLPSQNLSNDAAFASDYPSMAFSGNNVYVTWQNNTSTSNTDILFTVSGDNGTGFSQATNLSKSLSHHNSANQQIAASGSYVYVVWQDNTTGNSDIWLSTSSNRGQSFPSPVNLSNDLQQSVNPQIAVSGSNVYVTWATQTLSGSSDILFSASSNNGLSFSVSGLSLSNDLVATDPLIAAAGSNVYIAWQDNTGGNHDIYFRASSNNGLLFGASQNLSKNTSGSGIVSFDQEIAVAGSNVYLLWTRASSTVTDTSFASSGNSGISFSAARQLTTNGNSLHPQVAVAGSGVYVVWEDHSTPGISVATLVASTNSGTSFGATVPLSSNSGFSNFPQVAAAGSSVYVTWPDSVTPGNDVFLRSSSNSAASFGSTVNLSADSGFSTSPVTLASGNKVYVAWQDDTSSPGTDDIMFRSNLPKVNFVLNALRSGWNSTSPPGTTTQCTNTGCNPTLFRFKGKSFAIQIIWKDSPQQDIAIYTNGTAPGSVSPSDTCRLTNLVGCLVRSQAVNSSSTTGFFVFTPTVPSLNFTGVGKYEYYSQYNPTTMHGQLLIYKSPDMAPGPNGDGKVNILDIATIALAFGSSPGNITWNAAADMDNSGKIDILDIAFAALYYGQIL